MSYLVSKKRNFFKEKINNLTLFPLGSSLHVQLSSFIPSHGDRILLITIVDWTSFLDLVSP